MIRGLYIEERNNAAIHAAITAAICGQFEAVKTKWLTLKIKMKACS